MYDDDPVFYFGVIITAILCVTISLEDTVLDNTTYSGIITDKYSVGRICPNYYFIIDSDTIVTTSNREAYHLYKVGDIYNYTESDIRFTRGS